MKLFDNIFSLSENGKYEIAQKNIIIFPQQNAMFYVKA
jgi:hypothetical protein